MLSYTLSLIKELKEAILANLLILGQAQHILGSKDESLVIKRAIAALVRTSSRLSHQFHSYATKLTITKARHGRNIRSLGTSSGWPTCRQRFESLTERRASKRHVSHQTVNEIHLIFYKPSSSRAPTFHFNVSTTGTYPQLLLDLCTIINTKLSPHTFLLVASCTYTPMYFDRGERCIGIHDFQ